MRIAVVSAAICLTLVSLTAAAEVVAAIRKPIDIPAQELGPALKAFATARQMRMVYLSDDVRNVLSRGVSGDVTPQEALQALLAGTGLTYRFLDGNTVSIFPVKTSGAEGWVSSLKMAQLDQGAPAGDSSVKRQTDLPTKEQPVQLEEIVITGTHLQGVQDTASAVHTYMKEDIERAGVGGVAQFIQTLPQNFSGGASENTIGSIAGGPGSASNVTSGTGINLRGLGNNSTMVLINGHRVAPGGINGDFVDVSMIPLTALDRIEVVTDGASAVYGSDAVGGVVNFILRKDFQGLETRLRGGAVSDGGSRESQLGQTGGLTWATGSALLSYEYYDRTPLTASARSFSQSAVQPFTLLPEQVRHSVFASGNQSVNPDVSLFADGSYSHRSTDYSASQGGASGFLQHTPAAVTAYNGTLGAQIAITDATSAEISTGYAGSDTRQQVFNQGRVDPLTDRHVKSGVLTVDGVFRSTLGTISNDPIRYALGAQYRHESLDYRELLTQFGRFNPSRNIVAGFLELRLPLIGPSSGRSNADLLELSLADREERYSDFGSTNNPQAGLILRAFPNLTIRSTVGRSFKAPLLYDLNPMVTATFAGNVPDPRTGTQPNTLYVLGGNADLHPEKATTWTVGFDYKPDQFPLRIAATYYNIHYTDRVAVPGGSVDIFNPFAYESVLGPALLRNPPSPLVQQYTSLPIFTNSGAGPIAAFLDDRTQNLSILDTDGVDSDLSYHTQLSAASVETGIAVTYILEFATKFTSTASSTALLDRPYNPLRLKLRARLIAAIGPISVGTFLNHVSSYDDARTTPATPVASWTTLDLTGSYQCRSCVGFLKDLRATLGIVNVANKNPPFVANANGWGVNFDGANANALGRFFSFEVDKKW